MPRLFLLVLLNLLKVNFVGSWLPITSHVSNDITLISDLESMKIGIMIGVCSIVVSIVNGLMNQSIFSLFVKWIRQTFGATYV